MGVFETVCPDQVTGINETCNGIDDDCDGTIDNGALITFFVDRDGDGFGSNASGAETRQSCDPVAGFVANDSDCNDTLAAVSPAANEVCDAADTDEDCDGMVNESCGCSNVGMTQACCAGRGAQTCEARDGGATLSMCTVAASPEVCNGIDDDCDGTTDELYATTAPDGGVLVLTDGGVIGLDGRCSVGVGACARTAGTICSGGSLSCAAVAGSPGTEICNNLDDDCDGQTDEASTGLCPATGQACTGGSCQCPAGQAVCGTSCQPLGGVCTRGTGACVRTGSLVCTSGSATCSAVAGTPGTETCNNVDDDCDGQTDEAAASLCPASGQTCSIGTCSCPGAQVVCGSSCQTLGGSCSAGLGACLRNGAFACISGGAACNATPGTPGTEICDGIDNNCDGAVDEGVKVSCYPDTDNDTYSNDTTVTQQCRDNTRASFGFCPTGFVAASLGKGTDCNSSDPNKYVNSSVRVDADGDTYCIGAAFTQCGNGSGAPGTRLTTNCNATDDCKDSNSYANQACFLPSEFQSVGQLKICEVGVPKTETFGVLTHRFCPPGFSRSGAPRSVRHHGTAAGTCTPSGDLLLTMTCDFWAIGNFVCNVQGDCVAN
ncbi:MAG: MopE-related protein [Archangium sp.]|nr:MopE-related protein [Archangium sp.]MDP3154066.1 MopE-related protein [Archangium sp.]MDP3570031.1 MopE-related protein [Archangium sp.]